MKTVTVTYQNAINYGAILQAYALQQQLHKLGIDDELLDLKRTHRVFNKVEFNKHMPGNIYSNMLNVWHILQTQKRMKRFREFVETNIRTTRHYRTFEEVIQNPPVADVYITGSDQTFNTNSGVIPCNFLKFGNMDTKRISYAASMGRPAVEDKYLDDFITAIKTYSFLSVREQHAADYISKMSGVPCLANIDPTLLLSKEEWSKLASTSKPSPGIEREKYILVYQLLENPLLNNAVKKIKKETGLKTKVINPYACCRVKGDVIIRDAGPLEFLGLYRDAEYVLTTSFHGTCFSILFQKPFFSFIRKTGETRINGILKKLNLGDRIITDTSRMTSNKIHYDSVNEIIEMERKRTIEYLVKALGL